MTDVTYTEPTSQDFARILASAKEGSQDAFGILYSSLHARILAFCRVHVGQDAPDCASETWISIAKSISNFQGTESDFRSWAITIAHRRCVDWIRRSPSYEIDRLDLDSFEDLGIGSDPQRIVESEFAATDLLAKIAKVLPDDQRDVVYLRVVAGLDSQETAEVLGKRSGAVRMLLHRALKTLAVSSAEFLEISSEDA